MFVELKSAKGTLSNEQKEWGIALAQAGDEYRIWRPEQWTDGTIEQALRARDPR